MPLRCLRWMWDIWCLLLPSIGFSYSDDQKQEENSTTSSVHFPDDVLIDILSRLPAESLLRCQKVSRHWRTLTSVTSASFVRLWLQRTSPVICMSVNGYGWLREVGNSFFVYDHHSTSKALKIKRLRLGKASSALEKDVYLASSCGGFLLFNGRKRCYFLNPLTGEHVGMYCPVPGFTCGFYYHSRISKFKVLYAQTFSDDCCVVRHYYTYTLGEDDWKRIVKEPPSWPYAPVLHKSTPAVCNGFLHWVAFQAPGWRDPADCSRAILLFRMDSEEFFTLAHPGYKCPNIEDHETMNLLVKDEQLALCNVNQYLGVIDIWILEDYTNCCWDLKWRLDLCLAEKPVFVEKRCYTSVKLVHIHNGELWLDCKERGIFVYDIERNMVTRLGGPPWSPISALSLSSYNAHECIPFAKSHLRLPKSMLSLKRSLRLPPF
ncbi:OLC1v1001885C1 [Oldenlandia corymbosa var. corymbosa]|uniref:OLC1v1001885C1 n=1 Tax=Oldenlandia corymbosa var. corymbosa TaxID=529605 RepID=A0AAV1D6K0_OLDCO|nr:OLC1v1001885C1 [Oldenlandia corymbosa var. corymbosa]